MECENCGKDAEVILDEKHFRHLCNECSRNIFIKIFRKIGKLL